MMKKIQETRAQYGVNGSPLRGCEVCWTCKYFPMYEVTEGFLSYGCYWHPFTPIISGKREDVPKVKPTVIRDPGWWRCQYWTEGEND